METLLEETITLVKSRMDVLPYWQQEAIQNIIKEAIELAYRAGREDQKYRSEGPVVNLY